MTLFLIPRFQALDSNGDPVSGAKLNFYTVGTSSAKNTYSDKALTTANANPVVANSSGLFGAIYLASGGYKVVLTDSDDVVIWTQDNVYADSWGVEYNGTEVVSGTSQGADVIGPSGANAILDVVAQGSTDDPVLGLRGAANGGMRVYWDESASTGYITQTDAAGTVEDIWMTFAKNGPISFYNNGTLQFRLSTTAGEVEVINGAGGSAICQVNSTGNGTARMYVAANETHVQSVQGSSANLYLDAYDGTTIYNGMRIGAVSGAPRIGFFNGTPAVKPTVTGSRGGNAALASLLTALAGLGLLTDSSS